MLKQFGKFGLESVETVKIVYKYCLFEYCLREVCVISTDFQCKSCRLNESATCAHVNVVDDLQVILADLTEHDTNVSEEEYLRSLWRNIDFLGNIAAASGSLK